MGLIEMSFAPRVCMRVPPRNDCFECTERKVGCHGSCEKYAAYTKKNDEDYWKMHDAYRGEWMAEVQRIRSIQEAKKRREIKRKSFR